LNDFDFIPQPVKQENNLSTAPNKNNFYQKSNFSKPSSGKPRIREIIIDEIYRPFFVFAIEPIPDNIIEKAKEAASILNEAGFTLRTDTVSAISKIFELIVTRKEEFLPWNDFNDKKSKFAFNTQSSKILAKMFSPKFDELKKPVQAFQARNARSVLGQNVKSPIHLAILWSPDGAQNIKERTPKSSFISHPLALVSTLRIPVFNLERPDAIQNLKEYLK
jgi:hypothetical protein